MHAKIVTITTKKHNKYTNFFSRNAKLEHIHRKREREGGRRKEREEREKMKNNRHLTIWCNYK